MVSLRRLEEKRSIRNTDLEHGKRGWDRAGNWQSTGRKLKAGKQMRGTEPRRPFSKGPRSATEMAISWGNRDTQKMQ